MPIGQNPEDPTKPQSPERAKLGSFSPKFQAIQDKKIKFFEALSREKRFKIAQEINEQAVYLQQKYSEDYDKWEAWHVITGSSLPEKADPDHYKKEDFPGDDSVEKFVNDLIKKYENQEIVVKKVLVVEDDNTVRAGLVAILEASGYEVVEAISGEEALSKLSEIEDIDAVLSDKNMGDMSGVDLLENIHKNLPSRKVLLILQTGMPELGVADRLSAIGAAYLQKPYEFKDLEAIFKPKKESTD